MAPPPAKFSFPPALRGFPVASCHSRDPPSPPYRVPATRCDSPQVRHAPDAPPLLGSTSARCPRSLAPGSGQRLNLARRSVQHPSELRCLTCFGCHRAGRCESARYDGVIPRHTGQELGSRIAARWVLLRAWHFWPAVASIALCVLGAASPALRPIQCRFLAASPPPSASPLRPPRARQRSPPLAAISACRQLHVVLRLRASILTLRHENAAAIGVAFCRCIRQFASPGVSTTLACRGLRICAHQWPAKVAILRRIPGAAYPTLRPREWRCN